ncbi:hypothetical protein VTK26DRAFT_2566 [Humicola hyalothermophila]
MTSILRQIVAGPRATHQETGLDLCYVTPNIIATSGPSQTYPHRAYRNPLDRLVAFLDANHGNGWAIWEFRAEGTGYPDEAVYHRIRHYPWPDHHPPPFRIVPGIVGGMRNWLRGGRLMCQGEKEGNEGRKEGREGEGKGAGDGGLNSGKGNGTTVEGGGGGGVKEKEENGDRVVVVHCKAGKGRSGTMACSYLIAECGWTAEEALARFTERRMRPGFGAGVSILSQLRWVSYVDRWTKGGKTYVDRPVEIVEVHIWGLRNGVKVGVEGFVEEGRKIRAFHTFTKEERIVVEGDAPGGGGVVDLVQDIVGYNVRSGAAGAGDEVVEEVDYEEVTKGVEGDSGGTDLEATDRPSRSFSTKIKRSRTAGLISRLGGRKHGSSQSLNKMGNGSPRSKTIQIPDSSQASAGASLAGSDEARSQSTTSLQNNSSSFADPSEPGGQAVIFKPAEPIRIPNSDVNISVERRNRAPGSIGLTMVTAVAHVWFNVFFEGNGPEQGGRADESGVFEMEWDKMDGIKGSSKKGTRALDRLAVVWRVVADRGTTEGEGMAINEPGEDSPVPQMRPADWEGRDAENPEADKHLGLRVEDPESQSVSKASSVAGQGGDEEEVVVDDEASLEGVKVSGPTGEEALDGRSGTDKSMPL